MKGLSGIIYVLLLLSVCTRTVASDPPFLKLLHSPWVDEKMENLSLEEKIGQLFMIPAYPRQGVSAKEGVLEKIRKYKPGGILMMQGTPLRTAQWINEFQEASTTPLMVAIDAEWGLNMRIDSTIKYPYAQAIGAIQDSMPVYMMGRDLGNQLKSMGIHINFAPVADVNTNPNNPVINFRSFGEDKNNVAQKAWWYSKGMQDAGIVAVAKHFPGHGDSKTDSHKTLPLIPHTKKRIDNIESFPFRYLTKKGISGIMSAHLNVPALDPSGKPSSLSKPVLTDYLKEEIGYSGLIFTDAMNMAGVRTEEGNSELLALKAGNDMVEFSPDLNKTIESVKLAVENGEITMDLINDKCRRILAMKYWVKLHEYEPAETKNLKSRLHSPYHEITNRRLIKGSLTVLNNNDILPVQDLEKAKVATLFVGGKEMTPFQETISKYTHADHYFLSSAASEKEWLFLRRKLDNYNLVICGVGDIGIYPSSYYGTSAIQRNAVSELIQDNKTVISFFGNAYALRHFKNIHHSEGLVLAYSSNELIQQLAAQAIFGAFDMNGKLPVTIDKRFKVNHGIEVKKNDRLAYTIPEETGVNSVELTREIDSIAQLGIDKKAYPGCQVLIAKGGKVIFHKCYGYHTYKEDRKVDERDIYDWASLTKVTGPLPAIMKLVDEKKIDLNSPFRNYWPDFRNSNKKNLNFREILAHQARLPAWIPFWQMTLDEDGKLSTNVFHSRTSEKYNIRVSDRLYMNRDFKKSIYDTIRDTELLHRKKYLYSGLSFYLYPDIISRLTGQDYESYLEKTFYEPLGAFTIHYNAYKHFPLHRIVPTERDDFFRKEDLRGFVHDEGAAMMGGISGNAGLFGSTNDLAKLFQMFLQKGYYGGRRYISEKTVNEFTRIQYPQNKNRRGLGFDKPLIDNHKNELRDAYPAVSASKNSFGHSGFTGTFAWADPDEDLLFIFMSNRVFPSRENAKLYELNIRTAMHQAIYDCLNSTPFTVY